MPLLRILRFCASPLLALIIVDTFLLLAGVDDGGTLIESGAGCDAYDDVVMADWYKKHTNACHLYPTQHCFLSLAQSYLVSSLSFFP